MKSYNPYNTRGWEGSVNNDPSMTVPNQVQSLEEMLRRVNNGFPLMKNNNLEWAEEEDEIPMPKINDLTDIDDANQYIKETFTKAKQKNTQTSHQTNEEANTGGASVASEAKRSEASKPTNSRSDE